MKAVLTVLFFLIVLPGFAGNQEDGQDSGILELAVKNRYRNPEQSLKTYNFLLKSAASEEELILKIKKLEAEILLKNYEQAIALYFDLKDQADLNSDLLLKFEFLRNTTLLFQEIGLYSTMNRTFEEVQSVINRLSKDNREQVLLDFKLLEFQIASEKFKKSNSLNSEVAALPDKDERKQWIFYQLGKLYFTQNSDSSGYYFRQVYETHEPSQLTLKAKIREKLTDEFNPVYLPQPVSGSEFYFMDLHHDIIVHNYEFWKNEEYTDSIKKYRTLLENIQNKQQQKLHRAKVFFTNQFFLEKTENTRQSEKTEKRLMIMVTATSVFLLLLYIGFRLYFDSIRKKRQQMADAKKVIISDKAEEEILKKLNEFEKSNLFLDKNIRLAGLAKQLNTNTRYLSQTINSEKQKSFNSYINMLRIHYILKKLRTNPTYLTYKISYLAEESGFASQSSFTSAFKEETGTTPSAYIKGLQK